MLDSFFKSVVGKYPNVCKVIFIVFVVTLWAAISLLMKVETDGHFLPSFGHFLPSFVSLIASAIGFVYLSMLGRDKFYYISFTISFFLFLVIALLIPTSIIPLFMRIAAGLMAVVLLIFLECKDWEKDETPEEQEEETDSDDEGPDTQQEKAPKKRDIVLAFGSLAAFILLLYYVINHGPDTPNGWTMWNLTVQALAYTALLLLNLAPTNKK